MRDLAHHLKKLNRNVIRSAHREEMAEETYEEEPIFYTSSQAEEALRQELAKIKSRRSELEPSPYAKKQTASQLKKQAKRKITKIRKKRAPTPKTPQEKNRLMKKRVPVFDRINNAKPKVGARPSKKKTARI